MGLRPFRWQPHDGERHAIDDNAMPTQKTTTLCGAELTVPAARPIKQQWCWPTCTACDAAWRLAEGIPLFLPQQRDTNRKTTQPCGSHRLTRTQFTRQSSPPIPGTPVSEP